MVQVSDSDIAKSLRRFVREAEARDEVVTVKQIRSRVEAELRLDAGFLKTDPWKGRSKDIIEEAFQEPAEEREVEVPQAATTAKPAGMVTAGKKEDAKKTKSQKGSQENMIVAKPAITPVAVSQPSGPNARKTSNGADIHSTESGSSSEGEDDDESDDGNDRAGEATLKKSDQVPAQVNGLKRKASAQRISAEGSESEDDDASKKRKTQSSSSATSDEGSQRSSNVDERRTKPSTSRPRAPAQTSTSTLQPIPAQAFHPPSGFVPVEPAQLSSNTLLSNISLEGKQIWHITAPSSVPISSISSFTLDSIDSHTTVASHGGFDYAFTGGEDVANGPVTIFIPTKEGYKAVPHKVHRKLQLQQKITLPNLTTRQASQVTGSQAAGDIAQAAVSSVRPQPKGLRMRYRPPGFGTGKLGTVGSGSEGADDDDEDDQSGSAFQFPKTLGAHGTDTGHIDNADVDVTMADADAQASAKKSKKEKRRKEKHSADSSGVKVNGITKVDAPPLPQSVNPPIERESSSPEVARLKPTKFTTNAVSVEDANKLEERAKRKEDKAKRKEERRLKRERKEARRLAQEAAATAA